MTNGEKPLSADEKERARDKIHRIRLELTELVKERERQLDLVNGDPWMLFFREVNSKQA